MSRILVVCVKFSTDAANGWLTNDLVDAFVRAGHTVDVIHLEWQDEHPVEFVTTPDGTRLLRLSALAFFHAGFLTQFAREQSGLPPRILLPVWPDALCHRSHTISW